MLALAGGGLAVLTVLMVSGAWIARGGQLAADPVFDREKSPAADTQVVPGKYIVSIEPKGGHSASARYPDLLSRSEARSQQVAQLVRDGGGRVMIFYTSVLIGFSAEMSPELARKIDALPGVRVLPVHRVRLNALQTNPPFGLDRISQRPRCLNQKYTYTRTGKGVHVYVIDTGILRQHPEFQDAGGQSRVSAVAYNAFNDGLQDDDGHGTHVAGTIGGAKYGVAKEVTLHSARVFQSSAGSDTSLVIAGIDWATKNAVPFLPRVVVNLSLSSAYDVALEQAVGTSIAKGLTYVVAAGNLEPGYTDRNACHFSPAHLSTAITVGASVPGNDGVAGFSFVGNCLDLFAPGDSIKSARNDLSGVGITRSGTSMAAAHVSGIAALYLQTASGTSARPSEVWKAIDRAANVRPGTAGWAGIGAPLLGSPNKLAHWGANSADGTVDGEICPG